MLEVETNCPKSASNPFCIGCLQNSVDISDRAFLQRLVATILVAPEKKNETTMSNDRVDRSCPLLITHYSLFISLQFIFKREK
jgi:hypothetical protein